MLKQFLSTMLAIFATAVARAATCPAGYLLQDDGVTCLACNSVVQEAHYCPDENTRLPCPPHPDNATAYYEKVSGIDKVSVKSIWANKVAPTIKNCRSDIMFTTAEGHSFGAECPWNGTDYFGGCNGKYLWYRAGAGYYLAPYSRTTDRDYYSGVKQCTNAPEHAHYTGAGTPDDPVKSGGRTDYNDCPWECDCGYVKNGNTCVPAGECTAGVKTLRTGTGLIYKLYSAQTTSPTIAIGLNGNVCYACLAPGAADAALNVSIDGDIYHATN